jgi:lipopolysaccharide export system protein LptA
MMCKAYAKKAGARWTSVAWTSVAICLAILSLAAGRPAQAQGQTAGQASQGMTSGLTQNFSANANKPVDINSEALEVDDKKKTATFKGKVSVVQGDFRLKSETIVVHYVSTDKPADGTAKAAPASTAALPGAAASTATPPAAGGADITTIDALGNVLVTSADGQTISGEHAIFDVKKQTVVVEHHVIVTRGETVLKGSRLTASIADGTYKMDALAKAERTADGQKESGGGISMRIVPGKVQEEMEQAKAQNAGKSDGKTEAKPPKRKPAGVSSQTAAPRPNAGRAENSGQ